MLGLLRRLGFSRACVGSKLRSILAPPQLAKPASEGELREERERERARERERERDRERESEREREREREERERERESFACPYNNICNDSARQQSKASCLGGTG